jgi:HK97 family phage major capsid protein
MDPEELFKKMETLVADTITKSKEAADTSAKAAVDALSAEGGPLDTLSNSVTEIKTQQDKLREAWEKRQQEAEQEEANKSSWAHPDLDDPELLSKLKWSNILWGMSQELKPGSIAKDAWSRDDEMKWTRKILMETKDIVDASGYRGKAGLQESIDEQGGMFVPMQLAAKYIDLLIAELVLTQLGASKMTNLVGTPVTIPSETGGMSFQFVGENGIPAESAPTYGAIKLEPKRLSGFVTVSNRLLKMNNASIESRLERRLVRDGALAAEAGILFGAGGIAPRGLFNTTGITRLSLNAGSGRKATIDDLELQRVKIRTANVPGKISYLTREEVASSLKTQKVQHYAGQTTQLGYVHNPMITHAELEDKINGLLRTTTAIPVNTGAPHGANTAALVAGVWEYLETAFWSRMTIRASREASLNGRSAWLQNETWWMLDLEMDSNVTRKEAFHIIDDASTV